MDLEFDDWQLHEMKSLFVTSNDLSYTQTATTSVEAGCSGRPTVDVKSRRGRRRLSETVCNLYTSLRLKATTTTTSTTSMIMLIIHRVNVM